MCVIARKPEIEYLSDSRPVEGGYTDVICQGKYYALPEDLKWKDMEDKYQNAERIVARYRDFCEKPRLSGRKLPESEH